MFSDHAVYNFLFSSVLLQLAGQFCKLFFVRKLMKVFLTKLVRSKYSYNIDIIFVKLFSFLSEPAYYMYVLVHINKKEKLLPYTQKNPQEISALL